MLRNSQEIDINISAIGMHLELPRNGWRLYASVDDFSEGALTELTETSSVRSDAFARQTNSYLINNPESSCNDQNSYLPQWRKTNSQDSCNRLFGSQYRHIASLKYAHNPTRPGFQLLLCNALVGQNSQIPQCALTRSKVLEGHFYPAYKRRRKSTCAESDASPRSSSVRHVRKVGELAALTKRLSNTRLA
ncbi:hypothetical protein T265_07394 [Opisthorchis viverrini]|uniref:Uncharacterized protein n=1 Tax=Opisthorchis viverrini TaxID=6198 RepID=A0A074ZHC5_OPIVI|nr:hypothetical protein T265_07394 [Opisthorchis viverrini]KER25107.1 hypothetical protein T265_07394 [Opisthorchis viverrini]